MVKITVELDNIDYGNLIDRYLPQIIDELRKTDNPVAQLLSNGMSTQMAVNIVRCLPQEKKDMLAAELINANAGMLSEKVEEFASQQNIDGKVVSIKAE